MIKHVLSACLMRKFSLHFFVQIQHVKNLQRKVAAKTLQRWYRSRRVLHERTGKENTSSATLNSNELSKKDTQASDPNGWVFLGIDPEYGMGIELKALLRGCESNEENLTNHFIETAHKSEVISKQKQTCLGSKQGQDCNQGTALNESESYIHHDLPSENKTTMQSGFINAKDRDVKFAADTEKLRWKLINEVDEYINATCDTNSFNDSQFRTTASRIANLDRRAIRSAMIANIMSNATYKITRGSNVKITNGVVKSTHNVKHGDRKGASTDHDSAVLKDLQSMNINWPISNDEQKSFQLSLTQELQLKDIRKTKNNKPSTDPNGNIYIDYSSFLPNQYQTQQSENFGTKKTSFETLVAMHEQRVYASEYFGKQSNGTSNIKLMFVQS